MLACQLPQQCQDYNTGYWNQRVPPIFSVLTFVLSNIVNLWIELPYFAATSSPNPWKVQVLSCHPHRHS